MRTKLSVIVLTLLTAVVLGACSPALSPAAVSNAAPRTISVTGTGVSYLTPDIATIMIGVNSRGENVSAALQENNAQAQAIADALIAMGIDAKDIQTSNFSVYPQQNYGPTGEITGVIYVVDNTVHVTVRPDRAGSDARYGGDLGSQQHQRHPVRCR